MNAIDTVRRRALLAAPIALVLLAAAGDARAEQPCDGGANPNLTARIVSPLRQIKRPFDHHPRGRFAVRLDNSGSCSAVARIGVKPLIFPALTEIVHGDHTHPAGDGAVMPTRWIDLSLPAGQSQSYVVEGKLPRLDYQPYRLTALVDTSHVLFESSEIDNEPDMISTGLLSVPRGNPREPGFDLYTSLRSSLSKTGGGVSHTLGLTSRPAPTSAVPSHDVFARFLLADVHSGKVFTLIYSKTTPCQPACPSGLTCEMSQGICVDDQGISAPIIDKEYYALGWNPEQDELGRATATDFYWQAPSFVEPNGHTFIPPGDYRFLTVIDTKDLVTEFDEGDNVDAVPFTLAPLEVVGNPNTWFVSSAIGPSPGPVVVQVANSYASELSYSVTVSGNPDWLHVTPTSGTLQIDQVAPLELSVDRGSLAPGKYTANLTVTAGGFEQFPVIVPVAFYVYDAATPGISLAPTTLDFSTSVGVHPAAQYVTIENTGTMDLDWEAWPSVEWISVAPPSGSGPAGYTEQMGVIIHPEGMAPGGPYIGNVTLFSSAPDGGRTMTARLVVSPCEQGWCNEGWACNGTTHLCEPPSTCSQDADCPGGQYCPPGGGYCQASGVCTIDTDCDFIWSEFGIFECNTARSTCELATCAADEDCPVASYCNEGTGYCNRSNFCTGDDQCAGGAPFAWACDEARQSCEPAVCTGDVDCPAASYCSIFWTACVSTAHCASDVECANLGMICDEPRDACRPG